MEWEAVLMLLASALIGGLVSGGGIAYVGYEALKGRLTRDFQSTFAGKADLDGVGTRVNALETVAIMAKDTADQNSDRIIRLEESGGAHSLALSRTLTRIDQRLDDMDTRQRAAQSQIDKTATLLDEVTRRLERANH